MGKKMKVDYEYWPEDGESYACITKGGRWWQATSQLQPEDADIQSSFVGGHYAELKAFRKYIKEEVKNSRKKLKALKGLYFEITQLREFEAEKHSRTNRFMRKKIHMLEKEVAEGEAYIEQLTKNFFSIVEGREQVVRQYIPQTLEKIETNKKNQEAFKNLEKMLNNQED